MSKATNKKPVVINLKDICDKKISPFKLMHKNSYVKIISEKYDNEEVIGKVLEKNVIRMKRSVNEIIKKDYYFIVELEDKTLRSFKVYNYHNEDWDYHSFILSDINDNLMKNK